MPELDDAITVEIKPEDIKMEVFRLSLIHICFSCVCVWR